jgi:hypothetical protein
MKKTGFLILFLILSLLAHLLSLLFIKVEIHAKNTPVVYGWPNIISKDDLMISAREPVSLPEAAFPLDSLRREYFAHRLFSPDKNRLARVKDPLPHKPPEEGSFDAGAGFLRDTGPSHFYLWEDVAGFTNSDPETVVYNIFVSPRGKVLLIYPDKLAANSSGNFQVQDHLRSASFFINDNFFWTKKERIVK